MADLNLATGVTVTVRPPDTPTILSGPPQTTATVTPPVFNVTIGAPLTPGLVAGVGTSATVMPGTAGPSGADGAPGPQGEPGPAGADGEGGGGSGGRLLSGTTAPAASSGLQDLDGINDPWRWVTAPNNFWIGPAYEVTWEAGDTFDAPDKPDPGADIAIYVVTDTTLSEALGAHGATPMNKQVFTGVEYEDSELGAVLVPYQPVGNPPVRGFMTEAGSGIAFITQFEADYSGPTSPPYPDEDITTLLGDLVVGDPYEFPVETGDGDDGDYYIRLGTDADNNPTSILYGPKTAGAWGTGRLLGFDRNANLHIVTGGWHFNPGIGSDPLNPAFWVEGSAEPPDDYFSASAGVWFDYDSYTLRYKSADFDGNISTGPLGGSTGGRLLSGATAPLSGSGLDPLDGINDPWRWAPGLGAWVGPAYDVTWTTGDTIPQLTLPAGAEELDLFVGAIFSPTGVAIGGATPEFTDQALASAAASENDTASFPSTGPLVADTTSTGVAFLVQSEAGYGGPTTVPDPTLDITTMLGDVTVTGPHVWDESGDGNDGDYWRNTSNGDIYGPKAAGAWPGAPLGRLIDLTQNQFPTGSWHFAPTDPDDAPSYITGGTEPDDGYINPGELAYWYDPTAAAPVVNFKAKDADGTVYVATLPMTPA